MDKNCDVVQLCAYLVENANIFFRIVAKEGIFMSEEARASALRAGKEMVEARVVYRLSMHRLSMLTC